MRQVGAVLWPRLRAVQVYGANTGVGKTVVSTLLCKALRRQLPDFNVHYLKPISTGPLHEADDRHLSKFSNNISTRTLVQFDDPVSPHLAARSSREPIDDTTLLGLVHEELSGYATGKDAFAVVETAGGVLSPAPSGTSQADFYRPLRLPTVLIGDHRLGGIGTTISAWESLHIRGYDINSIMLFEDSVYDNHSYLRDYFSRKGVTTLSLPPPPAARSHIEEDEAAMNEYYEATHVDPVLQRCIADMVRVHDERVNKLQSLPTRAHQNIWHPFMQHTERSPENILAIDSAYGDYFQSHRHSAPVEQPTSLSLSGEKSLTTPAFDGSASWWTQGLGHGNPELALVAAHAAGRYGHVMFGGAAHEPAISLAEELLTDVGNPRMSRVFYTDNGSTGMEVAIKMALKATAKRYGWDASDNVLILGLKGSYHGDTMGNMDASEPSVYNSTVQWYQSRGHWFDFPQVKMQKGKWVIEPGAGQEKAFGPAKQFTTLDDVFALKNRKSDTAQYERYIRTHLEELSAEGKKFGALIMEPVILGAGGMLFADPLFQHCLVKVVRESAADLFGGQTRPSSVGAVEWEGLPIISDEVFTGLYRLGRPSSSSFLDMWPDISVHAKLLTGGLLPLCTTLASESIYEAFLSPSKSDALLHGHSYTAHAVGCDVARHSIKAMKDLGGNGAWSVFRDDWGASSSDTSSATWSMWSKSFVTDLSHLSNVESVIALGAVLAISMQDPSGSGYTSTAGAGLRDKLLNGVDDFDQVIHSRVLGNVLYLMASMTSSKDTLAAIEKMVRIAIV